MNVSKTTDPASEATISTFLPEVLRATGPLPYSMTNDYAFRVVFQKSNLALKGLCGALLHIDPEDITTAEITNPILPGESISYKEYRLDINVLLNNRKLVNLEMQVVYSAYWTNRSIVYLCRNVEQLEHGQSYDELKPVVHIGIMDETLFPDTPVFYDSFCLMSPKTGKIYSDKMSINVLNLRCIDKATEEDRAWKLDYWARLFKSTTWEEIRMMAQDNKYMEEASNSFYQILADMNERKRCQDREDYYKKEAFVGEQLARLEKIEKQLEEKKSQLEETITQLSEKDAELSEKNAELSEKDAQLRSMAEEIARLQELLKQNS